MIHISSHSDAIAPRALHTLRALMSHWRRKPLQLFALVSGLMIATALWSGVQALNAQARDSYDRAAQMLGGTRVPSLARADGVLFSQDAFVTLRRAGWKVSPVLEGRVRMDGRSIRVLGIEPLTMPPAASVTGDDGGVGGFAGFLTPPYLSLIAPETLVELGEAGARPLTEDGRALPPLTAREGLAPGMIVTDIGAAQRLLDAGDMVSRLLLDPDAVQPVGGLPENVPLERVSSDVQGDLGRLTDSFHLNLTAFGLLAFLVGLFIVHSAIALAFEQRLPMLRTLRALGVSARMLTAVLLGELLTLSLLAGIAGVVGGYFIASALMPDVAASLGGLYGADVPGTLSLHPSWWIAGIAISVIGALAAAGYSLLKAYRMPPLASAKRYAWREAQRGWLRAQGVLALGLLALAGILFGFGSGLVVGFAGLAALLLGAALLLPPVLSVVLGLGQRFAKGTLAQWFWADAQQQLSGLSMALMALLLALGANIGVGTMVNGFRDTFTTWLDQRLVSEIYFNTPSDAQGEQITRWLAARDDVNAVLPTVRATLRLDGLPVEVVGHVDHATYRDNWPFIDVVDGVWVQMVAGEAVLVSEQLSRRMDVSVGDTLDLRGWSVTVGGIYPDYGNPKGQISADMSAMEPYFPGAQSGGYGIRTTREAVPALIEAMRVQFGLDDTQIIDQAGLKAFSKGVFEKTFAVTAALNVLTMLVAGFALFMSLLTLAEMRLPQLAPLWAGGVTRRGLAWIEMLKTLAMALFTALLAVPLGLAVAWCLVAVVNVQAFGWRLPFHLFPMQWLALIGLALLTAAIAAAWPMWTLRRMPPVRLVKVFTDER